VRCACTLRQLVDCIFFFVLFIAFSKYFTGRPIRVFRIPAFNFRGSWFKSMPFYWLTCIKFSYISAVPQQKCCNSKCNKILIASFLILSSFLIMSQRTVRCFIVRAIGTLLHVAKIYKSSFLLRKPEICVSHYH
jgi:hypothetical protein